MFDICGCSSEWLPFLYFIGVHRSIVDLFVFVFFDETQLNTKTFRVCAVQSRNHSLVERSLLGPSDGVIVPHLSQWLFDRICTQFKEEND